MNVRSRNAPPFACRPIEENIYTLKLSRRGHVIPKALHANMFLVRRAKEVMDIDVVLAPADMTFNAFLAQPRHAGRLRHIAVIDGNRILGLLHVNTALREVSEGTPSRVSLRDIACRDFTLVREDDIDFDVIQRMWRKRATMTLVMRGHGVPRAGNIAAVITNEHVTDSVATTIKAYPG